MCVNMVARFVDQQVICVDTNTPLTSMACITDARITTDEYG